MTTTLTSTRPKVAIQGYKGSFHHQAAETFFGENIEVVAKDSFDTLVMCTQSGEASRAVMAIENSIAGSIQGNYNLLFDANLYIIGEVYLQIGQHLMVIPGQTIRDLKEVHSHPMALFQCSRFFKKYPQIRLVESEDTAGSARYISTNKAKEIGAIASDLAAEIYGLDIIASHIEDVRNNFTRFLILSPEDNKWVDEVEVDKASIQLKIHNEPGSLADILNCISQEGINLSKIQSFPVVAKEWTYYIHLDLEFSQTSQLIHVLETLHRRTEQLKLLGVYKNGRKNV